MTTATTAKHADHELKDAVERELEWAANVEADRIGVAVHDRTVTLSGEVGTYPEKLAATRAALRVRGVTALADELSVDLPWRRDDVDIARDAATALERSAVVPDGAVKATVHDHVVTLSGSVPWDYQRRAAIQAVTTLRGVRDVRSEIAIKPTAIISPDKARAKITSAIMRNAQLQANQIDPLVNGTEITLTGTVSSWAARRQAEHAAWAVPGVTKVRNLLRLV
jgi:osmotically-inducible protein OsmY